MWTKRVKTNLNLFEHYYKCEPSRGELALKLQKVTKSIKSIYGSGLIESFSHLPQESFLRIDELDNFNFEGIKVFAIPDFAVKHNNKYTLYDWKTGKPSEKDIFQLSCYALYAMHKWKIDAHQIVIIPVYLTENEVSFKPIIPIEVNKIKDYMIESIEEMRSTLSNVKENKADIELCPKTNNSWRCRRCKFQEICDYNRR